MNGQYTNITFLSSLFRFQCKRIIPRCSELPKKDFIGDGIPLHLNLGRWKKALCSKVGNNEVSTDESLMPIDYARHSGMYSRTLILENLFLKPELKENVLTQPSECHEPLLNSRRVLRGIRNQMAR